MSDHCYNTLLAARELGPVAYAIQKFSGNLMIQLRANRCDLKRNGESEEARNFVSRVIFREQMFPILQMVRSPIASRVEVEVPTRNRNVLLFRSPFPITGIIQSHTLSAFQKPCIRIILNHQDFLRCDLRDGQ